jgi:two-component system chemotaxis response regulator CheB
LSIVRENGKIRVLVVDDSLLSREFLVRGLNSDPDIEVVAKASDPFEARDKIIEYNPDVMTCDIQMPKMDGIEFIRRLLPQHPLPVVVVSSVSNAIFDALNAGAVEFVAKPAVGESADLFIKRLIKKIKIASNANLKINKVDSEKKLLAKTATGKIDLIAMGASTGGTEALHSVIKALPNEIPGIVIVQHIPPVFSKMFADRLNTQTSFTVKEAENGDTVERGCVYIAPGQQNIKVKKFGGKYKIDFYSGPSTSRHVPSVDVLFESVAEAAGNKAIGLILTGMGSDGAKGLLMMRSKGARTIGQDEESSVVYGMPKVAYDIGAVEKRVSLNNVPNTILNMLL